MDVFKTYFVLNGLYNGEEGTFACATDGVNQDDGWYWIIEGMDDGAGPYTSKLDAINAAKVNPCVIHMKEVQETRIAIVTTGGFFCKPSGWDGVGAPINKKLLKSLPRYTSEELGISYSLAMTFNQSVEHPVFLVEHEGGLYVINTEGSNYARYIRYIGSLDSMPFFKAAFGEEGEPGGEDGPVAEAIEFK